MKSKTIAQEDFESLFAQITPHQEKMQKTVQYLRKNPDSKSPDIQIMLGVSESQMARIMRDLIQKNLTVRTSCKCGNTYLYSVK